MAEKPTYEELERRVQEFETDSSQLKQELHEARLFSEEIMMYMTEGLVLTDTHENVIFINHSLSEMLGYPSEEIIGKCWLDMVSPEQQDIAKEVVAMRVQGHIDRYEITLCHKDGHKFPVLIGAGPRFDKRTGEFIGTMGVVNDITERKQAEKTLHNSEMRYRAIVRAFDGLIYVCSQDYCVEFMNDRFIERTGYDGTGEFCYKALHNLESICPWCVNERVFKGETVRWEVLSPKDNCWYYVVNTPIYHADGSMSKQAMILDITKLKQAEAEREKLQAQLNQAQKMESVGRLAGGVAHDFNNMLGVILGHTELALLQSDENHELYSDLKEIQKAAERSADITKQLLAFARKQTISPKRLALNDTVESMLNMLRRLIGEDIDLVWQPAAHIWPVKMDPSQIDQILANLCVNARDAISGVGKLTIETGIKTFDEQYCNEHAGFIPGDFVLLAVSDNGCGMDKDTLDNLFEPFFTSKEVGKGTGLGLATIYGIVKQNNGFINVYSEPGQGSTFKIYLPRFFEEEETDMGVPEKKSAGGGTETILLVEDEPTILRMTRMMLEKKGYAVITAATPAEAVEKAGNHSGSIDLLMTDVVMPEMNGRDLAVQITELYPGIRHLFMSGYTANVIAHQGVLDDGVAFIQKPFSMADMTLKVREVLDTAPDKNQG